MGHGQKSKVDSLRLHAFLAGRVQGVGMRATVNHLARRHALVGWVRNLEDGRVELWAEGPANTLTAFLDELKETMRTFIREAQEDLGQATSHYDSFQIRF